MVWLSHGKEPIEEEKTMTREDNQLERLYAEDRAETDPCERLTPGCAIDHQRERDEQNRAESDCGTW